MYVGLADVRMRKDSAAATGTLPLFWVLPAFKFSTPQLSIPNLFLVLLVYLPTFYLPSHLPSCQLLLHLVSWFLLHLASHISVLLIDAPTPEPASHTTAWRHEQEKKMGKSAKPRKTYTCKVCGRPMTSDGHAQFFGQRYCPYEPGQLPQDVWLQQKRQDKLSKRLI